MLLKINIPKIKLDSNEKKRHAFMYYQMLLSHARIKDIIEEYAPEQYKVSWDAHLEEIHSIECDKAHDYCCQFMENATTEDMAFISSYLDDIFKAMEKIENKLNTNEEDHETQD